MVLEMFRSNRFEDVSLNQWMALTPKEIVESNICWPASNGFPA